MSTVLTRMADTLPNSWQQDLDRFLKEKGDNLTLNTKMNYAKTLLALSKVVPNKSLKELTKEEVVEGFSNLSKEYAQTSVNLYKTCTKRFYNWLYGMKKREYPPQAEWIEIRKPRGNSDKMRENLVTEEEVMAMTKATVHPRDKAFIISLYESAAREGELRSLRNKDVKFDKYGAVLMVSGKTGVRPIRIVNAAPYLQAWMNVHPLREDPNTPVWYSDREGRRKGGRGISKSFAYGLIRRSARKAGIKKKIHPHVLRHSRLTQLATLLKEPELRNFSGWTKNSSMPAIYVHLSGRDIDKRMLEIAGVKEALEEKAAPSPLEPAKCPRCGFKNPADSKYCARCSMVLDLQTAMKLDRELEETVGDVGSVEEDLSKLPRESLVKLMVAMDRMIKEAMKEK